MDSDVSETMYHTNLIFKVIGYFSFHILQKIAPQHILRHDRSFIVTLTNRYWLSINCQDDISFSSYLINFAL